MKPEYMRAAVMACFALGVTMADAKAESLDVKPGAWELTINAEMHGKLPISAEDAQDLPPQLRAVMERMMNENSKPRTVITTQCVTRQALEKSENVFAMNLPGMSCNNSVSTHSRTALAGSLECTQGAMKGKGDYAYAAKDREHVSGMMNMASSDGAHTMVVKGTLTGRWINEACDVTH